MKSPLYRLVVASAVLLAVPALLAQEAVTTTSPVSVVPHLIKYAGALPSAPGKASTVEVKFALYAAPTGGEALWSEKQQVALDTAGKYSVLLGSVTALPSAAFATGEAKWIGVTVSGQEEAVRTVLVATPYSLKASDAETLSGHPIADFALKNALPASGTNITQINVTNGVTGGGTGPTVTLGLSSTYLENLGDEIYPQLTGTNTLTGKNTYSAGKLFIGSSPVLSAANVLASSPVSVTASGNNVTIGLSDSALLTLGNSVYAQLAAGNTFSDDNAFKGITYTKEVESTVQFYVSSTEPGYSSVYSENQGTTSSGGVRGVTFGTDTSSFGVGGFAPGGILTPGVYGQFVAASGEGAYWEPLYQGAGVWADANQSGDTGGTALLATADDNNAGIFMNNSPSGYYTVFIQNDDTTGDANPFIAVNTNTGTSCVIDAAADLTCDGAYASARSVDGHKIATYGMLSAENWIEDFGSAQLVSGAAVVALDSHFAGTVNTAVDYHVFLTPNGDSKGLYVVSKGPNSFEVRESANGVSSIPFDYRIVAKPRGLETKRLEDVTVRFKRTLPNGRSAERIHPAHALPVPKRALTGKAQIARAEVKPK